MVGRRERIASRPSLVFIKARNTSVVVAPPSGALKQLNLRKQKIAVALVGGSEKPPSLMLMSIFTQFEKFSHVMRP
jgi:hypothetical protein